jgi:hypothetical protein
MLVGIAQIAGILERDPGMPGLEQHGQHLAPQIHGLEALADLQLAARGAFLIGDIGLLERLSGEVVQIRRLIGREQRPVPILGHALHEQIRHPVGGIHVMGAAAVVARVLAQIEELLDVDVPGFEIGADGALALAAIVDQRGGRHVGLVTLDLEVMHHRNRLHSGDGFDASKDPITQPEPVVLGQGGNAHEVGDPRHGRDAQIEGARDAVERDHCAIAAVP